MTRKCLSGVLLYLLSGMKHFKNYNKFDDSYFYMKEQSHSRAHWCILGKKIRPTCSQDDNSVLQKCFYQNCEELSKWKSLSEFDVFL